MTFGKKEIRLLIIFGLLLYAFLLYKFVIVKSFPKITEVEKKISVAKAERARLENDIRNKDIKKLDLNAKAVSYEKMDGYIPENANISDAVEYIDKLSKLTGKELKNVSISLPVGVNQSGQVNAQGSDKTDEKSANQCYMFTCSFSASLTYNEILDLLSFIEGSTKRVSISDFAMVPENELKDDKGVSPALSKAGTEEQKFKMNMTINLYSMKVESNDYGSSRLSKYLDNGWEIKGQNNSAGTGATQITQPANSGTSAPVPTAASETSVLEGSDLTILESSVMGAGDNLSIYGVTIKDRITIKTAGRMDIKMKLDGNYYTVEARASGKNNIIRCPIANKNEITVKVIVDFPDIEDNKDISLNLNVTNNTTKKINVLMTDKYGRVKIKDRSGSVIRDKSDREKLQII